MSKFSKLRSTSKTPYIFIMMAVVLVGLVYIVQTNGTATKGYTIMSLEERLNQLNEENKQLKMEATELQSLSRIEKIIGVYEMTTVAQIDYLSPAGSVVAVK